MFQALRPSSKFLRNKIFEEQNFGRGVPESDPLLDPRGDAGSSLHKAVKD